MTPLLLLILLGFNGAVYLVFGQIAVTGGANGLLLALCQAGAGAAVLWPACAMRGERLGVDGRTLAFYAGGALIGIVLPAVAAFAALPHVGAGLMATTIATSPVFTTLIAHAAGVERFGLRRGIGIACTFAGAVLIVGGPEADGQRDPFWLAAGLLAPFFLACGNVFRTRFWPRGHSAFQVGAGVSLAGVIVAAPLALASGAAAAVAGLGLAPGMALAGFIAVNGLNALPYYRLQQIAGPVYLSLLGHVIAVFGVLLGALALGERYGPWELAGVALVLAGVAAVTRRRAPRKPLTP